MSSRVQLSSTQQALQYHVPTFYSSEIGKRGMPKLLHARAPLEESCSARWYVACRLSEGDGNGEQRPMAPCYCSACSRYNIELLTDDNAMEQSLELLKMCTRREDVKRSRSNALDLFVFSCTACSEESMCDINRTGVIKSAERHTRIHIQLLVHGVAP